MNHIFYYHEPANSAQELKVSSLQATPAYTSPWPLSLLALKQAIKACSLPRKPVNDLHQVKSFLVREKNLSKTITGGKPPNVLGENKVINTARQDICNETEQAKESWIFEPELLSAAAGCHSGEFLGKVH